MGLSQPTTKRANLGSKVSTEQWKDYMLQEQLNR